MLIKSQENGSGRSERRKLFIFGLAGYWYGCSAAGWIGQDTRRFLDPAWWRPPLPPSDEHHVLVSGLTRHPPLPLSPRPPCPGLEAARIPILDTIPFRARGPVSDSRNTSNTKETTLNNHSKNCRHVARRTPTCCHTPPSTR